MKQHAVRAPRPNMSWHFAWRPLATHDEEAFDVLVGRPWLLTGAGVAGVFVVLLMLLPPRFRRRVVRWTVAVLTALGLVALVETLRGTLFPALTRISLPIPHLPPALEGLRIAHLSDFHLGMPLSVVAARRALALVEGLRPDMILLTGDFINYTRHLPLLGETLAGVRAPLGVFAVLGNHDHKTDPLLLARHLARLGIILLDNEHRVVRHGGDALVVAGVDDMWHGRPNLRAALRGKPAAPPVVLLAHSPDYADIASETDIAVQFAGHTHAGHIRLPWLGSLFLPRHGVRYPHGLWRVGDMWLVISNGLGGLPLRIGSRAEALLVTLRRG